VGGLQTREGRAERMQADGRGVVGFQAHVQLCARGVQGDRGEADRGAQVGGVLAGATGHA
jgi:hypothetical protein